MAKFLLLLLCALLVLVDPEMIMAAPSVAAGPASTEAAVGMPEPRPRYKRYRGNSRRKRGPIASIKRWGARRKTRRHIKALHRSTPRKGVIKVDRPIRNK
ncbi:hypothetical protein [Hymenobacter koreensis]|uniref:Uncharacterized protein n=1 Tax=Hymenobacter koreensis TaxID=1084523 RepID=A0ABP8JHF7_9BACT